MSLNISKTGVLKDSILKEYWVEPDGSIWEQVFHHDHLNVNNFVKAEDEANFPKGVYRNANMWFNFNVCNQLSGQWEILLVQAPLETDIPTKFRWIQTANPLTATYAQVAAANVTKITTDGYTNYSWGGIYPKKDGNTYLCANNGTAGKWWGAIGKYIVYQGGAPCWNGKIVTTGYVNVFVRIDSILRNVKIYKAGNHTTIENFYEY